MALFQPTSNILVPFMQPQFRRGRASGGGGGLQALIDTFVRSDSGTLGTSSDGKGTWSEESGDAEIFSNSYRIVTGGFANVTSIHSLALGSTTKYVKISFTGIDVQYPWIACRYVDSSSGYYTFQFDGGSGTVTWYYYANAADTAGDSIDSDTFGQDLVGDTVGLSITGAGASTVARLWLNPTNLPSSETNWDGDTTPNITLTSAGTFNADNGQKIGLGGQVSAPNTVRMTNLFAGGL